MGGARAGWAHRLGRRSPRAPVIYLVGTGGHPNYGDELIALTWARLYRRRFPDADIWLDSPRPGQAAVLLARAGYPVNCTDTLYHACWRSPSEDPAEVARFGSRVVSEPGLLPRDVAGVHLLGSADLIHVIGGGYINAYWPRHLAIVGAAREAKQRFGTRLAMTGAGLTPFASGSEAQIASHLRDFDIIDVRDEPSARVLAAHDCVVTNTADDAFLGVNGLLAARGPSQATVLCLQRDKIGVDRSVLLEYVLQTLTDWETGDQPLIMVECMPPDDLFGWDVLARQFPQIELFTFDRLWREGLPVGSHYTWISTRFHPHMLAAGHGAGGVALALGGGYYEAKHRSLIDLGTGWDYVTSLSTRATKPQALDRPYGGDLSRLTARKADIAERVLALVDVARP